MSDTNLTTANEPSVAELVDEYRNAVRSAASSYEHGHGHLGDADERAARKDLLDEITRLERRCAEMEKALRNTVDIYDDAAKLDEDSHDFNGLAIALLERETDNINAIRALLPPERANEGRTDAT